MEKKAREKVCGGPVDPVPGLQVQVELPRLRDQKAEFRPQFHPHFKIEHSGVKGLRPGRVARVHHQRVAPLEHRPPLCIRSPRDGKSADSTAEFSRSSFRRANRAKRAMPPANPDGGAGNIPALPAREEKWKTGVRTPVLLRGTHHQAPAFSPQAGEPTEPSYAPGKSSACRTASRMPSRGAS